MALRGPRDILRDCVMEHPHEGRPWWAASVKNARGQCGSNGSSHSHFTLAMPWGYPHSLLWPSFYLLQHTVPSDDVWKEKCLSVSPRQWLVHTLEKRGDSGTETWHRKEQMYTWCSVWREGRCIEGRLMKAEVWSYPCRALFIFSKSEMYLRVWCFSSSENSG